MTTPALDPIATVQHAPQIGDYRLDLATGTWWWSPETYRIHGFEPGEVVPTTAMVLAHKHVDDRDRVRALIERSAATGDSFRSIHRIVTAHGDERTIILLGTAERTYSGRVAFLSGCFIDVSEAVKSAANMQATTAIKASAANRSTIEQAKGALSIVFDVDPDTAFEMLRTSSSGANIPLRLLAGWVLGFTRQIIRSADVDTSDVAAFLRSPAPLSADLSPSNT